MAIGTSGSGRQTLTEINVTPLVDVMLVLLIIFMVTAPLIQQGVEVKLPDARAEPVKAEEEKLILSVKEDRSIWLGAGGDPARVPLAELEQRLRANRRVARDHELIAAGLGRLGERPPPNLLPRKEAPPPPAAAAPAPAPVASPAPPAP